MAASWQPISSSSGASSSAALPSGAQVPPTAVAAVLDSVDSEDDVVSDLLMQPVAAGVAAPCLAATPSFTSAQVVPTPLGRRALQAARRQ